MDPPDLYSEINDDPVPEGLSDAPLPEELYKRCRNQQLEESRLLETIKKLAEENKRILKERDDFEDECKSLRKRNDVYKKNAKMIFSVCRVELSKRERRIETLERRINSYGISEGNSYSVAANSNEDNYSTQISLNLDTELRYTGILSELNHELMALKSKASKEEVTNSNSNTPFDCRPFRGPKTPPTPSCGKAGVNRVRASSAERYDRKRDSRNAPDMYNGSQTKYRRFEHSEDSFRKLDNRNATDHAVDPREYQESRERRHLRKDMDSYGVEQGHSDRNYSRFRESVSKESFMSRPDTRTYSREKASDREYNYEVDRYHDRGEREKPSNREYDYEGERYHERSEREYSRSRGYESNQYRNEYKRMGEDHGRGYDHAESDDREARYMAGTRRNRMTGHETYEDYNRRESVARDVNSRERYSERHYYEENNGRGVRSQSSRRFQEDVHEGVEGYPAENGYRRHSSREMTDARGGHGYISKRSEKHSMHVSEKEVEKIGNHVHEREKRSHKKHDLESGSLSDHNPSRISPLHNRHIKEQKHVHIDKGLPPSNTGKISPERPHEQRLREKHVQMSVTEAETRMSRKSSSPMISPTAAVKSIDNNNKSIKSHINNLTVTADLRDEQNIPEPSEQANHDSVNSSPNSKMMSKSDTADPTTRNKMKGVRNRKPILFTKVKDSPKTEDLDSIHTSLDVAFIRDLKSFTAKEIFQRLGKEGLSRDDFITAEGVRIQQKEAEEAEADNFVLGSEYRQKITESNKPTDSVFTKRMRDKLTREESKASAAVIPSRSENPHPVVTSKEPSIQEQDPDERIPATNDDETVERLPKDEEDVKSPICYDDEDHSTRDVSHEDAELLKAATREPDVESFVHEEIVADSGRQAVQSAVSSPVKDSEALEWDVDDDFHLEEVDTAHLASDEEAVVELAPGEMEEGEILDDSEAESVSKDNKHKTKSKKDKRKSKTKKIAKIRGQKAKKVKPPAAAAVRVVPKAVRHSCEVRRVARSEQRSPVKRLQPRAVVRERRKAVYRERSPPLRRVALKEFRARR